MKYSHCFDTESSKIILGTDYYGEEVEEKTAFSLLDKFFDLGGTHIDTARLYTNGKSEELVGKWLKSRKPGKFFLATKGGCSLKKAPSVKRLSEKHIREDCENSLTALAVETIDLYWLHRDDTTVPVGTVIAFMNDLVREGKIKKFGASNWTVDRIYAAQNYARENDLQGFSATQVRFSPAVINPKERLPDLVEMEASDFSYYREEKMPIMAYSSQAKGFFSKMATLGEAGLSEKARNRYFSSQNLPTLERLKNLSEKYGLSVASLICGAFTSFDCPEVFPILGCKNVTQLADSLSGCDIHLSSEEVSEIFSGVLGERKP